MKIHSHLAALLAGAALAWAPAQAADSSTPLVKLKSNVYETQGSGSVFTLVIGSQSGGYIDVDCGYGPTEYEVEAGSIDDEGTYTGTTIQCQTDAQGIVTITSDTDIVIDIFNGAGCGIEWIEFADPTPIYILNLEHNSLKSGDFTAYTGLMALYISDNPFDEVPFKLAPSLPDMAIIEMDIVDNIDPAFDIKGYPKLLSFDALSCPQLTKLDPTNCPDLRKLSIDCTNVASLDVTKNPILSVLNISDTGIESIDLSKNPLLTQLYAAHQSALYNPDVKLRALDVTNNPELWVMMVQGNALETIDLSNNAKLEELYCHQNQITSINFDSCPVLERINISKNNMDFTTLPADKATYREYYYQQRDLQVAKTQSVGVPVDLSARVLRPDTETVAVVFSISQDDPENPVEVDASKYSYADGKVTFNEVIADSVYISYANSAFSEFSLNSSRFKVKDPAAFGSQDIQVTLEPVAKAGASLAFAIGIQEATPETPKNLTICDNTGAHKQTFTVTTSALPATANVTYTDYAGSGVIRILVDEGEHVSAFGTNGMEMESIDVTQMPLLRELSLEDAGLFSIDLKWNRCLQRLTLTGNDLFDFTLNGANGSYEKTQLTYIKIPNNNLDQFSMLMIGGLQYLDISNNLLTTINLKDAERLEYLDCSHNNLTELVANYGTSLKYLDCSYNNIASFTEPETYVIETLKVQGNAFTYATLPDRHSLTETHYTYAPQQQITIAKRSPGIDLSSQNLKINNKAVKFAWRWADNGEYLTEGVDYTIDGGRTNFLHASERKAYCELTCAAFPKFTGDNVLRTTEVLPSEMPTNLIATFTTSINNQVGSLVLASIKDGDTYFVDWNGDGTGLVQYDTNSVYEAFDTPATRSGAEVKVYGYQDEDEIKVFSISGISMNDFKPYGLKNLTTLTLLNTSLPEVELPAAPALKELTLGGNKLVSLDLSAYPNLESLAVQKNRLAKLDVSPLKKLELLNASNNYLEGVTFPDNCKLWHLDLSGNQLTEFDPTGLDDMYQLFLSNNKLTHLDEQAFRALSALTILSVTDNYFTFATLLPADIAKTQYTYGSQHAIIPEIAADGRVDLSTQAMVGETPTVFAWYIGEPELDENGEYQGELLEEGDEYTVTDGVTAFSSDFSGVMCLMTNEAFPQLALKTTLIDVVASSLETIEADGADASARYYDLRGNRVAAPSTGVYIVVRGNKVTKELLK